jgi:type I restriction enzyme R subunit
MSTLLSEIIAQRKEQAIEYEEYLKKIAELVRNLLSGHAETVPAVLDTPGKRALYNNLKSDAMETVIANMQLAESGDGYATVSDPYAKLALRIDAAIKANRPDGWRGVLSKEQTIKAVIYDVIKNVDEVERLFLIIKGNSEY